MTDQKDYTREPEVLAFLGWKIQSDETTPGEVYRWWVNDTRESEGWLEGDVAEWPRLTLSELLEGLCRVCRETGWFQPVLYGDATVLISGPDLMGERVFKVNEYGSLPNAVAAALHWVLQQREG